jgi:membrane fusion protein, multidrug efflux system
MRNIKKLLITTALIVGTVSCSYAAEEAVAPAKPATKADVYIVPVAKNIAIDLKYPAQINSFKQAKVYSRILGVLEEKYFEEGKVVNKGDVLFKIEDDLYQAKLDAANASVKMNEATLNNATRSWERIQKLYNSNAVTTEQRDSTLSAYQNALASLSMSKAELTQAKIDLDYTKVKAPISGVTSLKAIDLGNLVTANPPMELVSISQNDKVYIDFSMPLSDYENLKSGLWKMPDDGKLQVEITVNGQANRQKGVVDFIDVNIDQQTSTVKMRAIVENKDYSLMPGSFARVTLNGIEQKDVITIPQKALLQNPLGTIVFVEQDGVATVKPVKVGNESGDKFIVAGGPLQSGDKVIINNFFRIKPGAAVAIDKTISE